MRGLFPGPPPTAVLVRGVFRHKTESSLRVLTTRPYALTSWLRVTNSDVTDHSRRRRGPAVAGAHAVGLGGHPRHVPHVDAGRREDPLGVGADGQPLVAGAALRVGARTDDVAHARGHDRSRDRVRPHRPCARRAHVRRPEPSGDPRAAFSRQLLRGHDGRARRTGRAGDDLSPAGGGG